MSNLPLRERLSAFGTRAVARWRSSRLLQAATVAAVLLVVLAAVAWDRCFFLGCPDVGRLTSYRPGGASTVLDRNGRVFADLAPVPGDLVRLRDLPPFVSDAFIAVEDRRFREHGAVDLRRVVGAFWNNVRARGLQEGSSTLTMQLARNVFPDRLPGQDRTFTRKLLEVRVAHEIEGRFTKDEILELYLNHIYFGDGARGIEAASRHYFGHPARNLTLPQAALLAALPKAPSHYDPRRHAREARDRRDLVLGLMEAQKRVSAADAEKARRAPLGLASRPSARPGTRPLAAYFVEEVRKELEDRLGEDLYGERLRVHTTLDAGAQEAAEEELERELHAIDGGAQGIFSGPRYDAGLDVSEDDTPYLQGAVVAMDAATGDVLAWVGGRDFRQSRFDRVRAAQRQAGSAFKPFVYAAAVASGRPLSQTISDAPLQVSLGGARKWTPQNFDGAFEGQVTLRDALVRSKNVATVRLAQDVGVHTVAQLAEEAGIEPPIPEEPSMALGTVAVSPLELTSAYTAFAAQGEAVAPRTVLKVERENGEVVWEAEPPTRRRVMDAGVAYVVTDALREALVRGTGRAVAASGLRVPAAGKTGTTNDGADAWFIGYTPEVVAGVWIGFDHQRPIVPKATGGHLAAPVWARLMLRLYAGRALPAPWPMPADVVEGIVDPSNGLLLAPGCRPWAGAPVHEVFLRASQPATVCPTPGEAPLSDAMAAGANVPDYEEGLATGLPPEATAPASEPALTDDVTPLPRVEASPSPRVPAPVPSPPRPAASEPPPPRSSPPAPMEQPSPSPSPSITPPPSA